MSQAAFSDDEVLRQAKVEDEVTTIAPQAGPQTEFLTTEADIALYGGAAGGGKTFALLLDPLRHFDNGQFRAVIFRRQTVQVKNAGALWDESEQLYPLVNGYPREHVLEWQFPSGATVKFAHLELDRSVLDWQGSQIPLIAFDELTHFTEKQFFYMLSRNRSTSGVPGYIRATTNPDAKSWVRKLIDWYIDADGYAIPERAGKIRWFIRLDDKLVWADTRQELIDKYGKQRLPKSFTFIPSNVFDNKILLKKDPNYLSNLHALSKVDRERLLGDEKKGGNWNIVESAGTMFRREWFPTVDAIPGGWRRIIRYWDRAATTPSPSNPDPDWTRGLKMYQYPNGTYVVADLRSAQTTPGKVEDLVKNTASYDGKSVKVMSQQDPGSAGVTEKLAFFKLLAGHNVDTEVLTKNKVVRSKPVSAQAEVGNIHVLRAPWNEDFYNELENFPDGSHDDIVDVLSGAFNNLSGSGLSLGHSL